MFKPIRSETDSSLAFQSAAPPSCMGLEHVLQGVEAVDLSARDSGSPSVGVVVSPSSKGRKGLKIRVQTVRLRPWAPDTTTADLNARPANDANARLAARFWSHVDQSGGPDACWPWLGARNEDGYGLVSKRTYGDQRAHRVALACKLGRPVLLGLYALHACDNPPCCNPAHLHEGTAADNSRERNERGRAVSNVGENNGRATLTEEQVLAIRSWHASVPYGQKGAWFQIAADAFGVNRWAIWAVVYRITWRHLLPAPANSNAEGAL